MQTQRDRWEERCRETERHIVDETQAKQITKGIEMSKDRVEIDNKRREEWMWRKYVIRTEMVHTGERKVQRAEEGKTKLEKKKSP